MDSTRVKIEVMLHFLNGGEIEFIAKEYPDYSWRPLNQALGEPTWDWAKYDYRIKKTPKFRLPTKEEFESLIRNFSKFDEENNGLLIKNENDETLFLPTLGYLRNYEGWYLTSTKTGNQLTFNCYFNSRTNHRAMFVERCSVRRNAVRLVSDEPFEGGIKFNGIYWKTENEDGYYTYNEALEKFNK